MKKEVRSLGRLHGAGKWVAVAITTVAAVIGFLVDARSLGLAPLLGSAGASFANLSARRVVVMPARDTLSAIGDTLQLAALVTDRRGATIAGATVVWAAEDSAVASVDSSGSVVARGPGTTAVSATVRGHAGFARVTVVQHVSTVAILRDTLVRIPEGGGAQLVARALDAQGRVVPGRTARWESADTTVVAITPAGSASARAPGRTTLTAAIDGFSASVPAEVTLAATTARLVSGADQRASAGRRLPLPVAALVLSRGGEPVPGTALSFTPDDGQGTASPTTATTDRQGRAAAWWTLGPQAGRQRLTVGIAGLDTDLVVTAEAEPVPANTRIQAAGEAPRDTVGATAGPVGIRVTDSSGVAVADVPVGWTPVDGGAAQPRAPRTDSLGEAWAQWTLGPKAGTQSLRVQVGNPRTMPPFILAATALPGTASAVAVESGADQQGAVGTPLRHPIVARLTDRHGNLAGGAVLRVAAASGSVPDTTLVADARGRVSVRWTLGREAGPQQLELRLGEGAPVRVGARAHPLEPADAVPGSAPRSAPAGRALPRAVVFTVTDAYGNAIPDVLVAFTASSGTVRRSRVMTDARGRAAALWTLGVSPGEQTLTATVRGTQVRGSVVVQAVRRAGGR